MHLLACILLVELPFIRFVLFVCQSTLFLILYSRRLHLLLRGMKDLGLTMEFLQKGGTEFACLSTSASKDVAVNFAVSELPLVFKFETTDFTSRGADISFLSVYPGEQEALYPPLTYLRSVKTETEDVGGKSMLVATVQPVFM